VGLPNKDNLTYPVFISIDGGGTGSGFFLNTEQSLYLVTARHVLFKDHTQYHSGRVDLTALASDLKSKINFELDCATLFPNGDLKRHHTADVAVCKLANYVSATDRTSSLVPGVKYVTGALPPGAQLLGLPVDGIQRIDDVYVSNSIFLFGYPTSLSRTNASLDKSKPLLRTGIVAGKTDDGKIVIDCPVYFGNSGGLVIEVAEGDRGLWYPGIGIAVQMIPFVEELWSKQFKSQVGTRYENSGYALVEPMDRILELL
jgi:hypothetical protein